MPSTSDPTAGSNTGKKKSTRATPATSSSSSSKAVTPKTGRWHKKEEDRLTLARKQNREITAKDLQKSYFNGKDGNSLRTEGDIQERMDKHDTDVKKQAEVRSRREDRENEFQRMMDEAKKRNKSSKNWLTWVTTFGRSSMETSVF
jgi:hypothetical protein